MKRSERKLGLILAITSAVIYGIWPAAFDVAFADGANVVMVSILSVWIRAAFVTLACVATRRRLFETRQGTAQSALSGFYQAVSMMAIYGAVQLLPAPVAMIIMYTHTLMLLFFMAWRGEAVLNRQTVISTLAALIGLSFVVDLWHGHSETTVTGLVLAFAAAVTTVANLYVTGRQSLRRDPLAVNAETFLFAGIFVLAACIVQRPELPRSASSVPWLALGCASLVTGTFLRAYGIKFLGAFRWSLYLKLEPLFTALFSALLIHQYLNGGQYFGMAVLLASLICFQLFEPRAAKEIIAAEAD